MIPSRGIIKRPNLTYGRTASSKLQPSHPPPIPHHQHLTTSPIPSAKEAPRKVRKRRKIDETTIAGAQHRAPFSGPSLGYLIAELSATRPGMKGREEGQTMLEEHRTLARRVVGWVVGLPVVVGVGIVGVGWVWGVGVG